VIIEAVLLLGFALPLWSERTDDFDQAKKENAVRIRAVGFQFGWKFHYAGADGKFGFIDRSLATGQGDHCLDPTDPNGFDDFVTTELQIPVDNPVILQVKMETSVVCGQLCGDGHARMVGRMKVISQSEFKDFIVKQSKNALNKKNK